MENITIKKKANLLFFVKSINNLNISQDGFTLIEMLIVLFIIGVLSAIIAPNWLGFINNRHLSIGQEQVYQAMRQAQSQAKNEKVSWHASFREQNNIVQWAVHPGTIHPSNASWNNLHENLRLDLETTLQQSNGVRRVQFDHFGTVKPPFGRITLSHKSGGKGKRCVFVSTILGTLRTSKENAKPKNGDYCY